MRCLLAMFLAAALSACGAAAPAPTSSPTAAVEAVEAVKPSLPLDEVDARDLVESVGPAWKNLHLTDPSADDFSGGYSRMMVGRNASASIMTLANGQVWNVSLHSGFDGRCGSAAVLDEKLPDIVAKAAPTVKLTAGQLASLRAGLRSDAGTQLEFGAIRLSTVGGCMPVLDVRTRWS